ncbi:TonB-dependent receptor [uncultured Sphingomonas sp.]|uniref:TonB-dependent receptor n=1 Tax=uncultured Sphingomonas sp. TaxID=158754 RepID=UPI0025D3E87D|nr:TonB-dependent receptor [uncultured Sphingomonas sp.]
MTRFPKKCVLLAGCGLIAMAAPAMAQDVPPPAATTQADDDAADIIVTAQNRAERVEDVPIAIDVVGAEAIAQAGVTDFREVERIAPVLQITQDSQYTRVAVRGVGTNSNDEAQDQSIAINIDGEYLNRPNILNVSLFDLDRVEVLRGPQGTLYGRNATGGAINFITRKPGKEFGVNLNASYGNYNAFSVEGGIDVPFGAIGGLRLSGIYTDRDGYFYHPNIDARSGSAGTKGGRASLRLTPVSGLTVDLVGEYVEIDNIIPAFAAVDVNRGGRAPGAGCSGIGWTEVAPLTPGTQCIPTGTSYLQTIDRKRYDAPISGLSPNHIESTAIRGRLQYDFGPATFTYTGGYRDSSQDTKQALPPAYEFLEFDNNVETQSHEIRLSGNNPTGGFQWQVGGFYFNEKLDNVRGLFNRFIGPNGSYINFFTRASETKSYAAFGQVEVPFTDQLTAVGGLRYTHDDRTGVFGNYFFVFNSGRVDLTKVRPAPQVLTPEAKGEKVTWLAGLNYKPNADTLIYGKVSTGYKAGGFDSVGSYDPESNTAYEVGGKFGIGPHQINTSAFYYDYKDLQASVLLNPAVGGQIFNAGKATIWGIEVEGNFKLSKHDTFNATFNYLNAKYDDLLAAYTVFSVGGADTSVGDLDNNPNTVTQPNLAGNKLPQSPDVIITLGYDHVFDLGNAGTLTASAFSRFKSDYFLDIFNYNDSRQRGFSQTDVALIYRPANEKFSVQAFVRNLEDAQPLGFGTFVAAGPDDIYNWSFGAPRTYGARVTIDF